MRAHPPAAAAAAQGPRCRWSRSAESVLALDLIFCEAADARQRPAAVGDRHRDYYFVRARRVVDPDLHAVEMAPHIGGVLVAERDVEGHTRPAALLGGGDQRRALAEDLSDRRAELRVQDGGGVLQLAVLADGGGLAVALRVRAGDAEGRHGALRQEAAELLADIHELGKIFRVGTGQRV